ncbi:LysR family transcriptional regulator [Geomicrobium sp. JCM 19039]|uniref:LysR family transcriptional regulator n=1 Tax=Geomicrobium sp. JCM 19039 TaxID=1460636 RepID=UPI00045F43DA|nr:LysR family transcriptional regulator [Geomicrobium sp. JCM 19039]GAK12366.1 regulatory protein CysB [Geomicrobium sp. JCM 19039]
MDFKDFEILKAIHEEGNLTKVGNRLFISQPTVTHRIKQLEKQLEITILKRGRKGVEFTDQGLYLLKHSEKLLTNMRTLQENLWNLEEEPHGTLRIGASRSAALHLLPEILHAYSHKHPNVSYTITDGFNKEIIQSVYKEDVHVGIVRGDHHWTDAQLTLTEERICILATEKIPLDQLPINKRILYQTDPYLTAIIDNWWRDQYKQPPSVSITTSTMEIAQKFCEQGLGYIIAPEMMVPRDSSLTIQHSN